VSGPAESAFAALIEDQQRSLTRSTGERPQGSRPGDWTEVENRAIVDDYLAMLALECAGQPYSKTGHRNALIESMGGTRSRGSIERKHQNISTVTCVPQMWPGPGMRICGLTCGNGRFRGDGACH
jgi:hypothetical protein